MQFVVIDPQETISLGIKKLPKATVMPVITPIDRYKERRQNYGNFPAPPLNFQGMLIFLTPQNVKFALFKAFRYNHHKHT
jgi:hypothetical protein